jgi:hypothetical protein
VKRDIDDDGEIIIIKSKGLIVSTRYNDGKRSRPASFSFVEDGILFLFSAKCSMTGKREVSFGSPKEDAAFDTSCPIGRNPVKTLRTVKRVLKRCSFKMWGMAGDARLARFYAKIFGGTGNTFTINL